MSLLAIATARQLALFWDKVNKSGPVFNPHIGACWQWLGAPIPAGYGLVTLGSKTNNTRRRAYAHRLSWEIHNGTIPAGTGHHGTVIMHRCDNRLCVNPYHLIAGTQGDNLRDMTSKGRGITPGLKGESHPLTPFKESDIRTIRASRLSNRKLAAQYGVSKTAISRIRRRISWSHLA